MASARLTFLDTAKTMLRKTVSASFADRVLADADKASVLNVYQFMGQSERHRCFNAHGLLALAGGTCPCVEVKGNGEWTPLTESLSRVSA